MPTWRLYIMNDIKGILNKDQITNFLKPLQDLSYYGINKIVLNFSESEKNIFINAKTENDTDRVYITFNSSMFNDFYFSKNVSFGIYNLSEFISILKHFDDKTIIQLIDNKFIISNEMGLTLEYYSSNIKNIPHLEKKFTNFNELNNYSLATFQWSSDHKKNLNIFNCLSHKELLLSGNKEKTEILFTILNKNIKVCDTIKFPIKAHRIVNDFHILFEKEKIYNILSSKKDILNIYVSDKFICFHLQNDFYVYTHFVTSLKSWNN